MLYWKILFSIPTYLRKLKNRKFTKISLYKCIFFSPSCNVHYPSGNCHLLLPLISISHNTLLAFHLWWPSQGSLHPVQCVYFCVWYSFFIFTLWFHWVHFSVCFPRCVPHLASHGPTFCQSVASLCCTECSS